MTRDHTAEKENLVRYRGAQKMEPWRRFEERV